MSNATPVTAVYGDGIGPEIMAASLHIIQEAGARIQIENIEIGEKVYPRGNTDGIEPGVWESLLRTKVLYKALNRVLDQGIDIVKTETLGIYDGKLGYTLAQGR